MHKYLLVVSAHLAACLIAFSTQSYSAAPNYDLAREAGDVVGTVTYCGAVYQDLRVVILGTSYSARTGTGGAYKISTIQEGFYKVVFKLNNLEVGSQEGVQVIAKQTTDLGALNFCVDADADGFNPPSDCNDANPNINPSASEVCGDGLDNNCNKAADENCPGVCLDLDKDGFFGQPGCSTEVDCYDIDAAINPKAEEVCDDGVDNNCNGTQNEMPASNPSTFYLDSDGDGFGVADQTMTACSPDYGYVAQMGDCDDTRADINPGQLDICDSIDNNCNGSIDEDAQFVTYYQDSDNDGYGNANVSTAVCGDPGAGYVTNDTDCDDNLANVWPGAQEVCDGLDNNCVNGVDENLSQPVMGGTKYCSNGVWELGCSTLYLDCDGAVDNGCETYTIVTNGTLSSCTSVQCGYGAGNCDSSVSNGCETILLDDDNNCGSCYNECSLLDWCVGGQCEFLGI